MILATADLAAARQKRDAAAKFLDAATHAADSSRGKYTEIATHCLVAASTNCRASSGLQVMLNKLNELHSSPDSERNTKLAELQDIARQAGDVNVAEDLEQDEDVSAAQLEFTKLASGSGALPPPPLDFPMFSMPFAF